MYLEIEICIYCPARQPVAFSERVVLQEQSGAAIAAAASAGPWPALSAQQVPVPGRGTRDRGLCRSPRFWRKVLICRATPPPTLLPGSLREWYQALAPQLLFYRTGSSV